ncbi:class I SAM-dependent methyltransferase [Glycocaulis sp.]
MRAVLTLSAAFPLALALAACGAPSETPGDDTPAAIETDAAVSADLDEDGLPEGDGEAALEDDGVDVQADAEPDAATSGETGTPALSALPETGSLAWAVAGEWRGDAPARDIWRNPRQTLEFFGVDPSGTLVEIWPAGGWYTQVLAPWIAANGGTYVAAHFPANGSESMQAFLQNFSERFSAPLFGEIVMAEFGPETGPIVEPGSADAVLTFRNVHNWMARGFEEKAFADFYAALRPGGILGVVEHRLPASQPQDPRAASGYVQEDYVIALAIEAGFELVSSSEINANPADTADHPFGVWTLPPVRRSSPVGEEPDPDFDQTPYDMIGESDRMTLLFRKPE